MEKTSGNNLIKFAAAKFPVVLLAEEQTEEMKRLFRLLSNYQLGLLSEDEVIEMNRLQKKVYGDSIMYRDATLK